MTISGTDVVGLQVRDLGSAAFYEAHLGMTCATTKPDAVHDGDR